MKNCQTCRGSLGFQDKFSSQKSKNADSNIYLLNTPVTARTVNLLCMLNCFIYLLKLHAFAEALKKLYLIQTNGKLDFVAAIYALAKYTVSVSFYLRHPSIFWNSKYMLSIITGSIYRENILIHKCKST